MFDLEQMLAKWEDPATEVRLCAERLFLRNYVFQGLIDLKPAFDSPQIAHFRAADFLRVVDRCTLLGVRIIGVEICGPEGEDVDIEIPEEESNAWCVSLVQKYQDRIDLSLCATYEVPDSVLSMPPASLESLHQALQRL